MKTFDKINRRTHLFLGLFLMPWLLMYGVSSLFLIHQSWSRGDKELAWEPLFEKAYRRPASDQGDLRATAQAILKDCNLEGAFWPHKPKPDTLQIDRLSFLGSTRLTYSMKDQKLKVERQRMRFGQAAIRMHFRVGNRQPGFWNKFWGLLVDFACVGIIIWVVSGLIMWWRLRRLRAWGAMAVGCGALSFLLLIWKL